jgi:DUF3048 family protein/Big-like domain-containing protein
LSLPTSLHEPEIGRPAWPAPRPPRRRNVFALPLRRAWLALAALVAVVCTSGGGYLAYLNTLPTAASFSVTSGQRDVPTDKPLILSFNRDVPLDALQRSFSIVPETDGTLVSLSGQKSYQFLTVKPLLDLTKYTVTLQPFYDTTRHQVKGVQWSFTTTIVPRITSVTGPNGAPITNGSEIQPGTTITIAFNDAMVTSTVKMMLGKEPLTLSWAPGSRVATVSTHGIPSGPLLIKLAPGATDQTGHTIKAGWTLVTGLYYRDQEHTIPLKYPALIQIPNDALAVDQNGLQSADIVYEYLAEGGITRLTAIFDNAPDLVGPIRSSRLVSLKLGRHYKGLLFQSGESAVTEAAAGSDPVPQFFDTIGYTFRTPSRYAPDNLMITGDGVNRAELRFYPNLPAFTLQKSRPNPTGGTTGTSAAVTEHYSTYAYDPIMGTYQKTESGHLYRDPRSGQPLRIEMLIVMHTQESLLQIGDGHGSYIHDFNLDTTGAADVFYKGQHYAVTWNGNDVHNPITFTTADGQPLALPPGLVWVDITA